MIKPWAAALLLLPVHICCFLPQAPLCSCICHRNTNDLKVSYIGFPCLSQEPALEAKPNIMRISCLIDLSCFTSNVIRTWRQTTRPHISRRFPMLKKDLSQLCVSVERFALCCIAAVSATCKQTHGQAVNQRFYSIHTAFTSVMKMAFVHMLDNG